MADQPAIDQLRANIADVGTPPAYADLELSALLDAHAGVEPRARVAALLPLWAEAAGRTDYTAGSSSEKLSQAFDQLRDLLTQAQADAAAVTAQEQAGLAALAQAPTAIPVQFWF